MILITSYYYSIVVIIVLSCGSFIRLKKVRRNRREREETHLTFHLPCLILIRGLEPWRSS